MVASYLIVQLTLLDDLHPFPNFHLLPNACHPE